MKYDIILILLILFYIIIKSTDYFNLVLPSADEFGDEVESICSLEDVNCDRVLVLDAVANNNTLLFDEVEGGDETVSVGKVIKDDRFEVDEAFNESPTKNLT